MTDSDVLFIRKTHEDLRKKLAENENLDQVWNEHLKDQKVLNQYAESMLKLATEKWSKESTGIDRIKWCMDQCEAYFLHGGLEKHLAKDARRLEHYKKDPDNFIVGNSFAYSTEELQKNIHGEPKPKRVRLREDFLFQKVEKGKVYKLLDVGSCYNPFKDLNKNFQTTAIDLCPAAKDVYKCDFLNVKLVDSDDFQLPEINNLDKDSDQHVELTSLGCCHFDAVVFCLLLTYIPCPAARWRMCARAERVLKANGILIICIPDSNAQNKRSSLTRKWRDSIESIGFTRIHYHKSPHLHHFVFRKLQSTHRLTNKKPQKDGSTVVIEKLLHIPQDFKV